MYPGAPGMPSAPAKPQGLGPAITGLILGIIGIPLNIIPGVNFIAGVWISIIGLIFSVIGMRRVNGRGIAIAGLVLCIVGILITGFYVFVIGSFFSNH
jgi:hypothetical protein